MNCCRKLVNGETCPHSAIRRIELSARGLVFKVPVCQDHWKELQANKATPSSDDFAKKFIDQLRDRRTR